MAIIEAHNAKSELLTGSVSCFEYICTCLPLLKTYIRSVSFSVKHTKVNYLGDSL